MALGFLHRGDGLEPGNISPGCRSCTYTEGFLNQGWDSTLAGCGGSGLLQSSPGGAGSTSSIQSVMSRGEMGSSSPGGAGSTSSSQSAISQRDLGFNTVRGGVDPGRLIPHRTWRYWPWGCPFWFTGRRSCDVWKDFDPGAVPYRRQVAMALYTSPGQSAISQMGLGFPHCAGRCRPRRTRFFLQGYRSWQSLELYLNREWGSICS